MMFVCTFSSFIDTFFFGVVVGAPVGFVGLYFYLKFNGK